MYLSKRENFSVTLIQTNMEWIDVAFNLLCILKDWDFPGIMREFPKKKRQMSVFDNGVLSTQEDSFSLVW